MKKFVLILIVVIIAAAGGYYLARMNSGTSPATQTANMPVVSVEVVHATPKTATTVNVDAAKQFLTKMNANLEIGGTITEATRSVILPSGSKKTVNGYDLAPSSPRTFSYYQTEGFKSDDANSVDGTTNSSAGFLKGSLLCIDYFESGKTGTFCAVLP